MDEGRGGKEGEAAIKKFVVFRFQIIPVYRRCKRMTQFGPATLCLWRTAAHSLASVFLVSASFLGW